MPTAAPGYFGLWLDNGDGVFNEASDSLRGYVAIGRQVVHARQAFGAQAGQVIGRTNLGVEAEIDADALDREKQLGLVLEQTLTRLSPPEHTALEYAAVMPPDNLHWPFIHELVKRVHPDIDQPAPGYPDPWIARDKAFHFDASAGIAAFTYAVSAGWFVDARWKALAIGGGTAIAAGAGKELIDATHVFGGDPSWRDLAWDGIGTVDLCTT